MSGFSPSDLFLVTGASSGIGEATALGLCAAGATVIAVGRDHTRLEALRTKAARPSAILPEPKDLVEDIEALPAWLKSLKDRHGKLRGLVHSAGITQTTPVQALDLAKAKALFDVNYFAAAFLAKGFLDRRVNIGAGASLTFLASASAGSPNKGQTIYAASKAAIVAMTRVVAKEVASRGIRVNCVSPAIVETPMTEAYRNEHNGNGEIDQRYPLGLGKAADISSMIVFLSSDAARWITGQNHIIDGGRTL